MSAVNATAGDANYDAERPGVSHGCLTKGDETVPGEREAMVKAKDRAVTWWREWLL